MGSHHHKVAILVPDDKIHCFDMVMEKIVLDINVPAFYTEPRADGSPLLYFNYFPFFGCGLFSLTRDDLVADGQRPRASLASGPADLGNAANEPASVRTGQDGYKWFKQLPKF